MTARTTLGLFIAFLLTAVGAASWGWQHWVTGTWHEDDVVVEVLAGVVCESSFHGPVVHTFHFFVHGNELQLWQFAKQCRCLGVGFVRVEPRFLHLLLREALHETHESVVDVRHAVRC